MIQRKEKKVKKKQMINDLPDELLFMIFTYLDIEKLDILNLRFISIKINKLLLLNITLNKYPNLNNNSFFRKCVRKRIFNREVKDRLEKINNNYEKNLFGMLLEGD